MHSVPADPCRGWAGLGLFPPPTSCRRSQGRERTDHFAGGRRLSREGGQAGPKQANGFCQCPGHQGEQGVPQTTPPAQADGRPARQRPPCYRTGQQGEREPINRGKICRFWWQPHPPRGAQAVSARAGGRLLPRRAGQGSWMASGGSTRPWGRGGLEGSSPSPRGGRAALRGAGEGAFPRDGQASSPRPCGTQSSDRHKISSEAAHQSPPPLQLPESQGALALPL